MVKLFGYSFDEQSVKFGTDCYEAQGILMMGDKPVAEVSIGSFADMFDYKLLVSDDEWANIREDVQSAYIALGNDRPFADAIAVLVTDLHVLSACDKELAEEARKNGFPNATLSVYTEDDDSGFLGIGMSYASDIPEWAIDVIGEYPFGQVDVPRVA